MSRRTLTRSSPPDLARVSCIWRKLTPSGTCFQGICCNAINLAAGTTKLLTIRSTAQIPPASTGLPALRLTSPISMTHTPVSRSPAINARWIGAGPRYAGSRLGWTFNSWVPGKRRRKDPGRIRPKEAVTRRCEPFWKAELSGGGVKGGGGCYKRKTTVTHASAMHRSNELTSHFLNATLSSGIVCTGTPSVSPTVLSGAVIGKARDCHEI